MYANGSQFEVIITFILYRIIILFNVILNIVKTKS